MARSSVVYSNVGFFNGSMFLGLFLVLIGGYYIARDLGWITLNVSIWAIIAFGLGLLLLFSGMNRRRVS
jgi:hypothetical protein